MTTSTSAGYRIGITLADDAAPGALARVVAALHDAGGDVASVEQKLVDGRSAHVLWVDACSEDHQRSIEDAARAADAADVLAVEDRVFEFHCGGKIHVAPRSRLQHADELAMAYTPGVGRVSSAIAKNRDLVWDFTIKRNSVAVLSNGTAVLGLGDIGPEAAMPVMEGKAMLFREFAGIDAYPLCVNAADADALVAVAQAVEPGFGGINLEDVAAPVCFDAERRMRETLGIPVFHDDQHGTAVVTLTALLNAARVVNKPLAEMRAVFLGAGAAGIACARLLLEAGVGDVVMVDRNGIITEHRAEGMNDEKRDIARITNRDARNGSLEDALKGADVFIGVSGPGLVQPQWLETMAEDAIVFAMANPIPEIMPELVPSNVAVVATGRSDYPNQINNVLVFPGFFRGLLDASASTVTEDMKLAAAHALAALVSDDALGPQRIVPSPFDPRVVDSVAEAVKGTLSA